MIQSTTDLNGRLALDAHSLDSLKLKARQDPDQALKGAAQQFEAVFLHTLLKSMRDATPKDGLMDSDQTRTYTSMLDQQMAQSLSTKGIGLADVMLRQLTRNRSVMAVTDVTPATVAPATATPVGAPDGIASSANAAVQPEAGTSSSKGLNPNALKRGQDFLMRLKDHAVEASNATGIPARFLLGQAALESGWGKHEIRAADGTQTFNLFGVKAGKNWKGATVDVMTTEYVDGVPRKVAQKFRAYGSYSEAFQDYASLMQGNRRYASVLKQTSSTGFAQGLQRAGYATDPQYADKLTRILNGPRMRQTIQA